jgi:hypothetical protein
MPQASRGLVGISYIGAILRIFLHVSLISISHNRINNYQLQGRTYQLERSMSEHYYTRKSHSHKRQYA